MAKIEIQKKHDTLWDITVDGNKKTALATGVPNRVFQGTDMSRLRNLPGYVWTGNRGIEEWPIEGTAEWDNQVIFWGDRLELTPIDTSDPLSQAELIGISELFLLLRDNSSSPAFSVDSFFRTAGKDSEGTGLFCFPLNLMEFVHSRQSKELLMSREIYNHPELKGEERLSHSLAILTFQSLTGELPFSRTGGYEWIHEEMRKKRLPSLVKNGIGEKEIAEAVDKALSREEYLPLEAWAGLMKQNHVFPGAMPDTFKAQMEKYEETFVKGFNRRKNQVKITVAAVIAVAIIWIGGSLVKNYLEPPYTADMTPRDVVEAYYEGINSLDTTAIDGTTVRKAGKDMSNQVATMHVLSKQKQAYSQGQTISPEYWGEQGYPVLPAGYSVYGISALELEDKGNNTFEASYLIWYPPSEDINNPGAYVDPYEIHRKEEMVTVIRDNRDRSWIIGEFTELSSEPVPSKDVLPRD